MRLRNAKFYSIYFLIMLSYIIIMGVAHHRMLMHFQRTFNIHMYHTVTTLLLILLGFILGFDQLYQQYRKKGKWHVDGLRLLCLGLPCFILFIWNLGPIMLSQIFPFFQSIRFPPYPLNIIVHSRFSLYAITTLIGYVIATSFYKEENIESKDSSNNE
ncbi:MAG: hypothetical protein MJA31_17995 [Clostridia bacterium]|nr:hypothetical protein [Clostridia bacterium]